jgi:hypothetical protein
MRLGFSRIRGRLPRLVLATLAWLPLAFAVWYFTGPLLTFLVKMIVEPVSRLAFGDIVSAVEQQGSTLTFVTKLRPGDAQAAGNISVDVNTLLYAYGMPMFAALTLAAREPRWPQKLLVGLVVMLPLVSFGVIADCLKNVVFSAGPLVTSQTGFSAPARDAIAFSYQFGALIMPTVAPAALWVLLHRRLLESLRDEPDAQA